MYADGAPRLHPETWAAIQAAHVPVLGICYGMQLLMHMDGGKVEPAPAREYGKASVAQSVREAAAAAMEEHAHTPVSKPAALFEGLPAEFVVWMSHGDKVTRVPEGWEALAATGNAEWAAAGCAAKRHYALQFHPEVTHTPQGTAILRNFVIAIAGATPDWTMADFLDEAVAKVQHTMREGGRCIGAVSGGVDSTVAAALMARAVGDRFTAVFVDHGMLRKGEREEVVLRLRTTCGIDLRVVDAQDAFLSELAGVEDPEQKRKIIGRMFIETFDKEASDEQFLCQGTVYPDVIESGAVGAHAAVIKSHHNVGGLPPHMRMTLIEPLRELYKDEVRALGVALGLPHESVWRHPFPGPGLGIRTLSAITKADMDMLREVDAIFMEELRGHDAYHTASQAFAVLLPCKSVGVMGDSRTYDRVVALRAVTTSDFMTADVCRLDWDMLFKITTRIINEVRGVSRVTYDLTFKPPGSIEWL